MSQFSEEIKAELADLEASLKGGSVLLLNYVASRRAAIADAVAANDPQLADIIRHEVQNMKTYAATEAVRQADKVDGAILNGLLVSLSAFDTLLLTSIM